MMSINIIYTCKNKLIGIDAVLPLLMEISHRFKNIIIIILFIDKHNYKKVKDNHHIWKQLNKLNAKISILYHKKKIRSILSLIRLVLRMVLKKNILIKNNDILYKHRLFINVIKKISNTTEIYANINGITVESHRLLKMQYAVDENIKKIDRRPKVNYDYYISSLSQDNLLDIYNIKVSNHKFKKIGYHRKLQQWNKFINEEAKRYNFNYFVYYLSNFAKRYPHLDEPEQSELLEETLYMLKKYNNTIKTIFKPHIITDMDLFRKLLQKIHYKNYIIDYSHPMILAYNAKFIVTNNCSNVIYDAYYLGRPIILYTQYDQREFKLLGGKSELGDTCDFFIHRDPEKFISVISGILNGTIKVSHDENFIKENFPDTPKEFWDFLDLIMLNKKKKAA